MVAQAAEQLSFDFLPQTDLVVQRHQGQLTSDAGLIPVRQFDRRWRYTERMAECRRGSANVAKNLTCPEHDAALNLHSIFCPPSWLPSWLPSCHRVFALAPRPGTQGEGTISILNPYRPAPRFDLIP